MSEDNAVPDEAVWDKENLLKLCDALKSSISYHHTHFVYTRGMKQIDWNKVAFPPFSPEACQKKWTEMLRQMHKIRTLTELISEAEEILWSPIPKHKIHPDFVKKPCLMATLFQEVDVAKMRQLFPELKNKELFKLVINKYKSLSDEEKAQYVKKYKLEYEDLKRKRLELNPPQAPQVPAVPQKTAHCEHCANGSNSLPSKPPSSGYSLFCLDQPLPALELAEKPFALFAKRWRETTQSQREDYNIRCNKLKQQYAADLNEYLNKFSEEQQQQILNDHGLTRPPVPKHRRLFRAKRLPGEPRMPATGPNVAFVQNQMKPFAEKIADPVERFGKLNHMWRDLPAAEKQCYKDKVDEKFRQYSKDLQMWFKKLTPKEQDAYWRQNPSKHRFLKGKTYTREKQHMHVPSDSEDEDIEISSSEDEVDRLQDDDDDDDEDDGDITFDM